MFVQSGQVQFVFGMVVVGVSVQVEVDYLLWFQGWFQFQVVVCGEGLCQVDEDFLVVQCIFGMWQYGFVEMGYVMYGEDVEGGVVVIVFQWCGGWQDEIGVVGCFVDVEVDVEYEFQVVQGLFELFFVGCGQYWVVGYCDQCVYLFFVFIEDFFC